MSTIHPDLPGMVSRAADAVRNADDILIVSHIDADGITSAAIAYSTCIRRKMSVMRHTALETSKGKLTEKKLKDRYDAVMKRTDGNIERRIRDMAEIYTSAEAVLKDRCVDPVSVNAVMADAKRCLDRDMRGLAEAKVKVRFAKKMDPETIRMIRSDGSSLVWICDLGSGYKGQMCRDDILITDHHVPDSNGGPDTQDDRQTRLWFTFDILEINPVNIGMEGSTQGCGASVTYLVAREVDPDNRDLAQLAVVGACGDMQDLPIKGLTGINAIALKDAEENGDVVAEEDLRFFGRETRPLINYLKYSGDPEIPGISDDGVGCSKLLRSLDIELKDDGAFRTWNDLNPDEKERITRSILDRLNGEAQGRAYGFAYTLPKYPRHTEYRDAKEFATMLNSCGRYDDAETGMQVCIEGRDASEELLKRVKRHRSEHTENINRCTQYILENDMIRTCRNIRYFFAGDSVEETVVGIVAGSLLSKDPERYGMPMMGFVDTDDGVKVSARADRSLVKRGLDLSAVMNKAAGMVGGYGGGHNIAAGATIPKGTEKRFLDVANDIMLIQIV